MCNYFGTDGIRDKANTGVLHYDSLVCIAHALLDWLNSKNILYPVIYIGRDTRLSGKHIETVLANIITLRGGSVRLVDVIPTGAISYAVKSNSADLGIMVTASHNPYTDNGLKFFKKNGYKLSDTDEEDITRFINLNKKEKYIVDDNLECVFEHDKKLIDKYIDFCKSTLKKDVSFSDMHVVIDTANGSMYECAPKLFESLNIKTTVINSQPDGLNINDNCGSQYTEELKSTVKLKNADMGIAFDGDGDRCIVIDENGNELTGDHLLAIGALELKRQGILNNNILVVTTMTNLGIINFIKENDINVEICDVGDRKVMEKMDYVSASLGGENSGHVIYSNFLKTGDGLITALQFISTIKVNKKTISELTNKIELYPQLIVNVPVTNKPNLQELIPFREKINWADNLLDNKGRILVRYSGTESICRIMVEGENLNHVNTIADDVSDWIKRNIK